MALGVGDGPGYVGYGVGDGNGAAGIGGSGKFFACLPSISSADITISFFSRRGKSEIILGSFNTRTDPDFGNATGLCDLLGN